MLFIAGTKGETTIVAKGEFYCPECNAHTHYHHNQVHEKATVFFVPVVNLKLLGEYIECQSCGSTYKMEILDYDPEKEQQEIKALYLGGIKKVMTTMMLADGRIDENEKSMMKDVYKNIAGSALSDYEIDEEIKSCKANPVGLDNCLKELFPYLNEAGKEAIIKAAYWISVADGEVDKEEKNLLIKLGKRFQISNAHLKGIISE
ncbi:MAG: TerB family tellurite resistance protein, partial [Planctomycetota bacterium]